MAFARLVAGGIHEKMMKSATETLKLPSYWTIPTGYEIEPLMLTHVMLAFILCLCGLSVSIVAFIFEIVPCNSENKQSKSARKSMAERAAKNRDDIIMNLIEL